MRQPVPFGKYLMLERVNVGGMAEIFLARARSAQDFQRILAIKKILPTMAEDEEFIAMFIDEARIAAELSHTGIVQIYELGKFEDDFYISMEFVHGKDLRFVQERMVRRGQPMPLDLTAYVGSRLLEALDYAHAKRDPRGRPLGIIHRDISPQNVILSFDGEVKICDFGIAKAANRSQKTQAGVLKGKFGYMSPEQVRGMPLDGRSDIFTVGTLLYEMTTLERLFIGESDFSTLEKVRNADVVPPSTYNRNVPEPLEDIILQGLAKDVEDRYQSAGEMSESLHGYLMKDRLPSSRDLSAFMRETFPAEYDAEMRRLEEYQNLSEEELLGMVKSAGGKAELEVVDEGDLDSKTLIFASSTGSHKVAPPPLPGKKERPEGESAHLDEPWILEKPEPQKLGDQRTQVFSEDMDSGLVRKVAETEHAEEPVLIMSPSSSEDTPPDGVIPGPSQERRSSKAWVVLLIFFALAMGWGTVATYLWLDATSEGPLYPGKLELRSRPASDLLVLLDGDKVADKTPFILAKIDPGEHHIKILRKGYATYEHRFTVKPNLELWIDAAMLPSGLVGTDPIAKTPENPDPKKDPGPGLKPGPETKPEPKPGTVVKLEPAELLVESKPQGAAVYLAGVRQGKTPYRFRELKPGKVEISVKLKGHRKGSRTIRLKPGASERMLIKLSRRSGAHGRPSPPKNIKHGYLLANTRPWSKVYVDDKYTGRQTPIAPDQKLKLTAGKHKVSFETPDGMRFSFEVLIKPDETKKLIKKLE